MTGLRTPASGRCQAWRLEPGVWSLIAATEEPMFITKNALARRTVLRGLGTTLALPFLESMVPAFSALAQSAARTASSLRRDVARASNRLAMFAAAISNNKPVAANKAQSAGLALPKR